MLDDILESDISDDDTVGAALLMLPHSKEGLSELCTFLIFYENCTPAWRFLFSEFSDLLDKKTFKIMYEYLKSQYPRFMLRNEFSDLFGDRIKVEDSDLVSKFPQTQEGFKALYAFLQIESNCVVGWERLFSSAFERLMTEEKRSVIETFLLETEDYESILAVFGFERAEEIFGFDLGRR